MNHVGLTHVGINAGMVPHSVRWLVKGRMWCKYSGRFKASGIVSIMVNAFNAVNGIVYAPNFYNLYCAKATEVVQSIGVFNVMAKHQKDNMIYLSVKSALSNHASSRFKVTSVLFGGILFGYTTISSLASRSSDIFHVISNLHGIANEPYKVFGRYISAKGIVYAVKGVVGNVKAWMYNAKSTLLTVSLTPYKVTSFLKNTVGAWYFHCTGGVEIMAYITSVPHRVQEFVTNKRWFRG